MLRKVSLIERTLCCPSRRQNTIVENKQLTEVLAHVRAQQAAYAPN
jgi:hypothetical protein